MIILDENTNEQASIDSKELEVEGSAVPVSGSPTVLIPPPPPYDSQVLSPPDVLLPVQNQQPILSHPSPPIPPSRQSPSKRFLKALVSALLIIALIRMFVWSVDSHGRRDPREWMGGHKPHDAERFSIQKPDRSACAPGITHPNCSPHPFPKPPPRRIAPIQYPPDSRLKPNSV